MKKSNLNKLQIQAINANMVKGGRKLRPDGTTNGSNGSNGWGNNGSWGNNGNAGNGNNGNNNP